MERFKIKADYTGGGSEMVIYDGIVEIYRSRSRDAIEAKMYEITGKIYR